MNELNTHSAIVNSVLEIANLTSSKFSKCPLLVDTFSNETISFGSEFRARNPFKSSAKLPRDPFRMPRFGGFGGTGGNTRT